MRGFLFAAKISMRYAGWMLSRLFGKHPSSPNPDPGPQLCMLALASGAGLTDSGIVAAWQALFPDASPLCATGAEKQVLSFESEGLSIMVAGMPMPIPEAEISGACARSWMWPRASEEMRRQKIHAVVTVPSGDRSRAGAVRQAVAVSRVAAAICHSGEAVGVYWGSSYQVHNPKMFIEGVQVMTGKDSLPCMLWVGLAVSASSPEGPYSLSTHGLRSFGHKELEVVDARFSIGVLRTTVLEIINYVLHAGPVLKHGQTLGSDGSTRWKIIHADSRFRPGEPVIRLGVS